MDGKLFCFKSKGTDESREVMQTRLLLARWISIIWDQLHDARLILRGKVILKIDFMVSLKHRMTMFSCSSTFKKYIAVSLKYYSVQFTLKRGLNTANSVFVRNNKSDLFVLVIVNINKSNLVASVNVGYNQCGCYFSHLPSCLAFSPASFGK
jgi:hypothetical protein